jgi:hypothetical protein
MLMGQLVELTWARGWISVWEAMVMGLVPWIRAPSAT